MAAPSTDAKVKKALARFKDRIEKGSYYEAQQTIRSITNRYVHAGNYEAATELLYQSSMILTEYSKYDEASDLYLYLLEVFELENKPTAEFERSDIMKIVNFLNALPDSDANVPNLAKETHRFATKKTGNDAGIPLLNQNLGEKLYYSGDAAEINMSQRYLFLTNEVSSLQLLSKLYFDTYVKENDQYSFGSYLARMVIPYLMLRNTEFASKGVDLMLAKLHGSKYDFPFSPVENVNVLEVDQITSTAPDKKKSCYRLINFLQLLVQVCSRAEADNAKNFRLLYSRYRVTLEEFNGIPQMVDQLGQLYFNTTVVRKQGNLLQDMMGSFLGGGGGSS